MAELRARDAINALLHRLTLAGLRVRLFVQSKEAVTTRYQPDPFRTVEAGGGLGRASEDRWKAMAAELPSDARSALDLGCNDGFFVFRLAQRGGICLGVDEDRNAVMIARARAAVHGVPNALFANLTVDAGNVDGLPHVDVVLCLSVFHHWVRHWGREEAEAVLERLAAHARHALVFETGQPDELGAQWADALSFMGPDPASWIRERLHGLGFPHVTAVGRFATTVSDTPRTMFVARRERQER